MVTGQVFESSEIRTADTVWPGYIKGLAMSSYVFIRTMSGGVNVEVMTSIGPTALVSPFIRIARPGRSPSLSTACSILIMSGMRLCRDI